MMVPLVSDVVVVVVVTVLDRFRFIVEEECFRVAAAASAASRTRRDGVTLRRTRPVMCDCGVSFRTAFSFSFWRVCGKKGTYYTNPLI